MDLEKCPFCQSRNVHSEPQGTDAAVHCHACCARGPIIDNEEHFNSPSWEKRKGQIEAEAIQAWNTRASVTADPRVAALEAERRHYESALEDIAPALETLRCQIMGHADRTQLTQAVTDLLKGVHRTLEDAAALAARAPSTAAAHPSERVG